MGGDFGVIGNEAAVLPPRQEGVMVSSFYFSKDFTKAFMALLSYTMGKSEFEDKRGDYVPSSWDARHVVNLTLGKRFQRQLGNWYQLAFPNRFAKGLRSITNLSARKTQLGPKWTRHSQIMIC